MSETGDFASTFDRSSASNQHLEAESFFRPLFESGLLLLCIRFAEPILFEPGVYAQLDFHPFWIVILLAAMQYGLFGGVAAAGLACLLMDWPPRPIGVDITQHYIELAVQPLHWLVVALFLGGYRHLQIRDARKTRAALDHTLEVNSDLAKEISRMDNALAHAELALVTHGSTETSEFPDVSPILALLHAPTSKEELGKAFADAAEAATSLPTGLLMADENGTFLDVSTARALETLRLEMDANSPLYKRVTTEPRSAIVSRRDIGQGDKGYFVISGVYVGCDPELAGIVFLIADEEEAAIMALAAAELLAIATSTALHTLEDAGGEPPNNIRAFPTAAQ